MPNKIKYTTTNIPYSIRRGNVAIGCENVGYGPTDNGVVIPSVDVTSTRTFWWNGITPPSSGYTIYQVKSDGSSPSIVCPNNDESMVLWSNSLGGSNITTIEDALLFVSTGVTNTIVVNKDYPNIVTSGLTLSFDASFIPSYPRKNTLWYDISGNGTNATLYNTPTFTNSTDTYFSFNKNSFEYAETSNISDLNRWTIESRFRVTSSLTNQVTSVVTNQFNLSTKLNFSMGTNNAPSNYNMTVGFFDGAWRNVTGFTPTLNQWYHVVGTYDGSAIRMYVDGSLSQTLNYVGTPQSGGTVRIARRWDSPDNNAINFFPGDIHFVRIYNRALSSDEINQNYSNLS